MQKNDEGVRAFNQQLEVKYAKELTKRPLLPVVGGQLQLREG